MLASSRGRAAPHHSPQGNGRTMCAPTGLGNEKHLRQHRTIPALQLKHRSGSCGTASALPKCSIMSGCGTRIVLRGQKPLALCDRYPCFGSLFPPLAALTFAASSIICAFGLASAAPRSPYRHLELCGIALIIAASKNSVLQLLTPTSYLLTYEPSSPISTPILCFLRALPLAHAGAQAAGGAGTGPARRVGYDRSSRRR